MLNELILYRANLKGKKMDVHRHATFRFQIRRIVNGLLKG
ncbi:hypothetical protein PsW64_00503 [Pseudovibrio sp. W64]|jgi:hypothetical protein|uniref:Uncharacterized protein n=2 Tax=Pseudovibrio TaxID=258255 RepID=A0A1I6ZCD6_9HYPH|nr:hypothetical protein PSE_4362 [Pseudovibrio sp. FO-BEG1]KZK89584.1 hypothetical protein PsAD5_04870 [Pseudovibrio sp. Ad5]KZK89875.1 hypothetical protein PsW64_00503 [Pseudovibrio sp. W64]KZK99197.1 hypothetical protein PsAD26_05007 [Pseudovibrio sp. Ad26]KZL22518.1 hypothetical protein PsWM33_03868 [Pseudovibrio sp. WM33]SFK23153.1 hypothetical protein SAMN04488518_103158 [Pseudovibrio ascidiaceicola]SFT60334.1 hypothetical protein SAMN05444141_102241 [Pseudovibrio denitrificans]